MLLDADEDMEVPVMLTVKELRHFISYMRALDNVASGTRKTEEQNAILTIENNQFKLERDEMFARLKAHEAHCGVIKAEEKQGRKWFKKKISSQPRH